MRAEAAAIGVGASVGMKAPRPRKTSRGRLVISRRSMETAFAAVCKAFVPRPGQPVGRTREEVAALAQVRRSLSVARIRGGCLRLTGGLRSRTRYVVRAPGGAKAADTYPLLQCLIHSVIVWRGSVVNTYDKGHLHPTINRSSCDCSFTAYGSSSPLFGPNPCSPCHALLWSLRTRIAEHCAFHACTPYKTSFKSHRKRRGQPPSAPPELPPFRGARAARPSRAGAGDERDLAEGHWHHIRHDRRPRRCQGIAAGMHNVPPTVPTPVQ